MRYFLSISALVFLSLAACKPSESTKVQTLDNFAGARKANICTGVPGDLAKPLNLNSEQVVVDGDDAALRDLVLTLLRALPAGVMEKFFSRDDIKGKIRITAATNKTCSAGRDPANPDFPVDATNIISCIRKEAGPVIYINNRAADIQHALIRAFGYYFSQELLKSDPAVTPIRGNIGKALLTDVARSDGKYKLKHFSRYFDEQILRSDLNEYQRATLIDDIGDPQKRKKAQLFFDYALAEAIDSYYCTKESRDTLTSSNGDFKNTGDAFADIPQTLAEYKPGKAAALVGGSDGEKASAPQGESFGLWRGNGRIWGFPLAHAFGNWRNNRNGRANSGYATGSGGAVGSGGAAGQQQAQQKAGPTGYYDYDKGFYLKDEKNPDRYLWHPFGGSAATYEVSKQSNGQWGTPTALPVKNEVPSGGESKAEEKSSESTVPPTQGVQEEPVT